MASIIVYDFIGLKEAILSGSYSLVILGNDIQIAKNGIQIPSSTSELTIDGKDPISGENHIILDCNSSSITDTIYIDLPVTITKVIIAKNLNLQIRNFYGLFGVYNNSNTRNVTLKYQNVYFSGVQAFYHRHGKCVLDNTTVLIDKLHGSVNNKEEVGEINQIEIYGKVDIISHSSANSTFYFLNANPKFTVMEEAEVSIYTVNRELFYCDNPLEVLIQRHAKIHVNCYWGMFYDTGNHRANSIIIDEFAEFVFQQRVVHGAIATIRCANLIINPNSQVIIRVDYPSAAPLIEITANGGQIKIDNPQRFILYNYGNRVLHYSVGTGTLSANAQQINYWQGASNPDIAGTISNIPTYHWTKADHNNGLVNATITNTTTTITYTNILIPDDSVNPLNSTAYPLHNAKVLSYGQLEAKINPLSDVDTIIMGYCEKNSVVLITSTAINDIVIANLAGQFRKVLDQALMKNTQITFNGANNFLYFHSLLLVDGSLQFLEVPSLLQFNPAIIPVNKQYILRRKTDWSILVQDTRTNGSSWKIYATIDNQLHSDNEAIIDGLVFLNIQKSIINQLPIEIYIGEGNHADKTITTINWSQLEGVLVEVIPDYYYQGGTYITNITWLLIPGS